ncbi:hypothetical protein V8E54_010141 [Elaphomyces granulatus]
MYLAFCHAGSSRSQRSVLFFLESYSSSSATLFVSPSLGLAYARRDPLSLTVLIAHFCSEWPDSRRYGSTTRCPATVCMCLTLVTEACLQDQMRRRILLFRSPKSLIRYRAFHGEPSHCAGHDAYASTAPRGRRTFCDCGRADIKNVMLRRCLGSRASFSASPAPRAALSAQESRNSGFD